MFAGIKKRIRLVYHMCLVAMWVETKLLERILKKMALLLMELPGQDKEILLVV